ncbi:MULTISPECIES: carboxymuconolactone decarboxylase family protein [unclassified Streptomyces]|uniref:carboxymuconolactone decarboxylase family protein n=1 Tax=unclassified Streptomyces TaxID=2593676 RepID=UPI002E32909A|nr:carboxymuconolactone decarboxylase family protein [Streptomyces sp. NBC_01431]
MSVDAPSALAPRTGEEVFRALAAPGDRTPWESIGDLAPGLGAHIQHGLGALVGDAGLDLRTRELATVCMLAALGDSAPQLAFHTAGALRAGATKGEVVQAVAQVALYAGIPRTLNALATVRPVLDAHPDAG